VAKREVHKQLSTCTHELASTSTVQPIDTGMSTKTVVVRALVLAMGVATVAAQPKSLVVYYSETG
jgi:hypothetical protein